MHMPVTGMFYERAWSIIRFERKALATCDNPVILLPDPDADPHLGVGALTAAAVLLPLGRRVALFMKPPGTGDDQIPGVAALARDLNQRTALNARRAIYHHPDDDPLRGVFVPPRREHEMTLPDISGFVKD